MRNPAAGRWGQPQDIGNVVVFLASRAANYVHGQVLAVDGGWMARAALPVRSSIDFA